MIHSIYKITLMVRIRSFEELKYDLYSCIRVMTIVISSLHMT